MIRLPSAWPVALLVALGLAGLQPKSRAYAERVEDVRGDAGGSGERGIEITVAGTATNLEWIRGAVRSGSPAGSVPRWARVDRFDPLQILHTAEDRDRPGVTLRCWVDLSDARRARLYFAARSGERFLVRDVELSGSLDEVDRQSLSQVIELSMAALMDRSAVGLTRAETRAFLQSRDEHVKPGDARGKNEPPAPPPRSVVDHPTPGMSTSVSTSTSMGFRGGVFYGAQVLGSGLPIVHGPGLSLSLSWGAGGDRWRVGPFASGQYQLPQEGAGRSVSMGFETVAARAGVELGHLFRGTGPPRRAELRLGFGADFVRVSPQPGTVDSGAALRPPWWSRSLVVSGALGFGWTLGHRVELAVRVLADLLPSVTHYDLREPGGTSPVFSPARVRPGLSLELATP